MGTLKIIGRIPSKKNSKQVICFGNKPRILSSKNFMEWHKDASLQLIGKKKIPNGSWLVLKFWLPDKRKSDLTNKAESVMDLLVDNGLLEDDNYLIVPNLTLQFEGIDKKNPRCEIEW